MTQYYCRCKIPSCDRLFEDSDRYDFKPNWLHYAVPFREDGRPETCQRFQYLADTEIGSEADAEEFRCDEFTFNQSSIVSCDEFVFATDELNIVNEVYRFIETKTYLIDIF